MFYSTKPQEWPIKSKNMLGMTLKMGENIGKRIKLKIKTFGVHAMF